ncbi:MAG: RdgB/HAM1 family non-canonical purine NTP pyrophosphatase [Verrucomicrobiota bacterium]
MDLVLATRNGHKTRELQRMLKPNFVVRDLSEHPEISEIEESGRTFKENAILKALAVSKEVTGLVVSDDSGLEVDALNGAPGIYSARYAGPKATDQQNIDKLYRELAQAGSAGDRSARFCCVLVLARDGQLLRTFEGGVEGTIVDPPRGMGGFGYDPIFQPEGFDQTFGELPVETKNGISHRARAVNQLAQFLSA